MSPARAPWVRSHVSLRMSDRRMELLRMIAAGMPPGASPTDAIDAALELAASGKADLAGRLDSVEDAVMAAAEAARMDMSRLESAAAKLSAQASALLVAISDAGDAP